MRYIANVDISNTNGFLSKEHGVLIKRGSVLEYEETPERIKRLVKIGIVTEEAAEAETEADPDPDLSPDTEPDAPEGEEADQKEEAAEGDESGLPDDIDELKKIADELGVQYARNIGVQKLKDRINEKVSE